MPLWTQFSKNNKDYPNVAYNDPSVTFAVQHLQDAQSKLAQEYRHALQKYSLQSDYSTSSDPPTDKEETKGQPSQDTEQANHQLHQGNWDWHSYMRKGVVLHEQQATNSQQAVSMSSSHKTAIFPHHFPETTAVLQTLRDNNLLFEGTPFGYAFYSTLHPHSSIQAHTAPMNFRLRIHVPIEIPDYNNDDATTTNNKKTCGIRVGSKSTTWHTDQPLVLDDAYNHQVWNDGDQHRVILLVDIWHPDVTLQEKQDIQELFQHAKEQGWIS